MASLRVYLETVTRIPSRGFSFTTHDLAPKLEYVYDARGRARPASGALDLGAFEYTIPEVSPSSSEAAGPETVRKPTAGATEGGRSAKVKAAASKRRKPRTYPTGSTKTISRSEAGR